MSNQGPIGKIPDPYGGYKVEGIGNKQSKDEQPPKKLLESNKGFLAQFFKALQKKVDSFLARLGGEPSKSFAAKKTLRSLKTSLETLKLEDRSQDVVFLECLSQHWNLALEESLEYNEAASSLFKIFVKKMNCYPENQQHTFGYYLTEHAGQRWVPFPYMELVQKIHREHEKTPDFSALTEWTRLLEDIIRCLEPFSV